MNVSMKTSFNLLQRELELDPKHEREPPSGGTPMQKVNPKPETLKECSLGGWGGLTSNAKRAIVVGHPDAHNRARLHRGAATP